MKPVYVLYRTSLRRFTANKGAVVVTFLVPVVLIYLFGHVFGLHGGGKSPGPTGIKIAAINQSADPAAHLLIDALRTEPAFDVITETKDAQGHPRPLTEEDARAALSDNAYRYALILPPDLLKTDGIGLHVRFLSDPRNEIESQTVNGLLQKAVFTKAPQLLKRSLQQGAIREIGRERFTAFSGSLAEVVSLAFDVDAEEIRSAMVDTLELPSASPPPSAAQADSQGETSPASSSTPLASAAAPAQATSTAALDAESEEMNDFMSQLIRIETEQVTGKEVSNPMAARMVGGYAVMFLLFALSASASSLFEDKRTGIFQRILAAPVHTGHILWSRFLFGVTVGVIQLVFLFVAGKFFFDLDLVSNAPALLLITLATAAACTALGMLIASLASSMESASGLATLVILPMTAIGGAWFPVTFLPSYIQALSKLSLVYWSVEAYASVLWANQSVARVLPHVAILSGMAAGTMLLATFLFRRAKLFE